MGLLAPTAMAACLAVTVGPASVASASPVPVSSLAWQDPVLQYPQTTAYGPTSVACPSTTLCVAVSDEGEILTTTAPTSPAPWNFGSVDPGTSYMQVACPSVSLCVAVTAHGEVSSSVDPAAGAASWHTVKLPDPPVAGWLNAVACPSATLCVITTEGGGILVSHDPAGGADSWVGGQVGPPNGVILSPYFPSLACPSVSLCLATDQAGDVFTSAAVDAGPASWTEAHVYTSQHIPCEEPGVMHCPPSSLGALVCPSVSLCFVSTLLDGPLWSNDPLAGQASWRRLGTATPTIFACATPAFCVGAAGGGSVLSSSDPQGDPSGWAPIGVPATSNGLTSISCPSVSLCVAVDYHGYTIAATPKPADVVRAQAAAALEAQVVPPAVARHLKGLVAHGGEDLRVTSPLAGTIAIRWVVRRRSGAPLVVASGSGGSGPAGSRAVHLALTNAGRRTLVGNRSALVLARLALTPAAAPTIAVTGTVRLSR